MHFIVDFSILYSEIEKNTPVQVTDWLAMYIVAWIFPAHHSTNRHKYRMLHHDTVVRTTTPDQV